MSRKSIKTVLLVEDNPGDAPERRKADQRFRDLLEAAPDAMVIVNQTGAPAKCGLRCAMTDRDSQAAVGFRDANTAWVIDTFVPSGSVTTSTRASSCFARAAMMLVPSPGSVLSKRPCGVPIPLSDTVSLQFGSAKS